MLPRTTGTAGRTMSTSYVFCLFVSSTICALHREAQSGRDRTAAGVTHGCWDTSAVDTTEYARHTSGTPLILPVSNANTPAQETERREDPVCFPAEDIRVTAISGNIRYERGDSVLTSQAADIVTTSRYIAVVLALAPIAKQRQEFQRLFAKSSSYDPKRDSPTYLGYSAQGQRYRVAVHNRNGSGVKYELGATPVGPGIWALALRR